MYPSSRFKQMMTFSLLIIFVAGLALFGFTHAAGHAAGTKSKLSTKTGVSSATGGKVWSVVPSANISSKANVLNAVAAVSASDIWAVGYAYNSRTGARKTLTEHWNGTSWSVIASPNPGLNNYLTGVAAISTSDVWAVGYYDNTNGNTQVLIEHWNGASWSLIASPSPGTGHNVLTGIARVPGTNELWAVGYSSYNYLSQTLTEYWYGTTWNIIPSPNFAGTSNVLNAIAADRTNSAWAVGAYDNLSNGVTQTLTERWNGKKWSIVSSPNATGAYENTLSEVKKVPGTNQFVAVGYSYYYEPDGHGGATTLVEQWSGTSWNIIPSPNIGEPDFNYYSFLLAVAVVTPYDIWAVGYSNCNGYECSIPDQTLIEHWDGTSWSIVSSPNVGSGYNVLNDVTWVAGAGQLWAVGGVSSTSYTDSLQTLTEIHS